MIKFKLIIINVLVFGNPKPGQGLGVGRIYITQIQRNLLRYLPNLGDR